MAGIELNALKHMSMDGLQQLLRDIEKAIDTLDERRRHEARALAEEKAREMGYTLSELMGRSKKSSRPPRYRHPKKPGLTWSGRGRRPDWLRAALQEGALLEDFES